MAKQGMLVTVPSDQEGATPRLVTESQPFPISLFDGTGNAIGSLDGAINTHDADVHTRPLNLPVLRCTGVTTNPTAPLVGGVTYSFDVTAGTGVNFPPGTTISITEGAIKETVLFTVVTQVTDTLTIDMPVGSDYTTAAVIDVCISDITSAAGTIASPQIYELGPPVGQVWHIKHFILAMTHTSAGADNLFGNITKLTNGIVFRLSNGAVTNFANWKTNGEIAGDLFDVVYVPAKGSADEGTRCKGAIKDVSGATVEIDGSTGAKIQILVQDDITALLTGSLKFQGHIEGE